MGDVFDTVAEAPAPAGGDVFDQIAPKDIFDKVSPALKLDPVALAAAGVNRPSQVSSGAPPGTDPRLNPDFDFTTAMSEGGSPKAFAKNMVKLPASWSLGMLSAAGKQAYLTAADAVSKLFNDPEYGGNLEAQGKSAPDEPLPVEKFVNKVAQTNPDLATAANIGEGATEMAPSLGIGFGGKVVNRLLAAGFSADMIATAPQAFKAYAEETSKPEGEQDAGKIAALKADIIQRFIFAPLAAHGAMRSEPVPAGVSPEANAAAVKASLPEGFVPKENYVKPGPSAAPATIPAPDVRTGAPVAPDVFDQVAPEKPAAVRIPDNAPPPQVPEGWDIHPTDHGIYLYDTERISPAEIDQTLPPLLAETSKATSPQAESATPETPAPAVAPPLTAPAEPAKVAVAAPETITGGTASDGTRGQTGPVLGNPGIPAEGEKPRSAAPSLSRQPSRANSARPFDIIDHIEGAYGPADPVEDFLKKAIQATEHDPTKLMEGVTGAPVWMTKAAVNLTLKAALHTYRATKDLGQAIAAGLKWLRAQNLSGFDEQQATEWLKQNIQGGPVQQDLGGVIGAAASDRKPAAATRPDEWSTTKGTTAEPFLSDLHSAFTGEGWRQRVQTFKAWLGGLAGETFPRTTRAAREVGEQMARWISSRMAALPLADGLVDDVLRGLELDDVQFGALLHEDNLRSIKKGLEDRAAEIQKIDPDKAFELRRQAEKVFTFIGKDGVWKDEAAYQEYLKNPRVQEAVKRYVDLRNRLIEPMYREAMKIEPDLQLEPRGLQTGARINLNWVKPGELSGPDVFVSNPTPRGVLGNVLTKRSPFGRVAKGTAAAYRPSFRDSIRNTYARQLEIANRNKFDRMLEQSGNAITGKPGERHTLKGEPAVPFEQRRMMMVRNTDGNIARVPMSQNLYVRQSLAGEYRRALNVEESWANRLPIVNRFNKLLNGAAISGLTDVSAHMSNLATMLFTRPGVTRSFWSEIGVSALGRADIGISLYKAFRKFSADDKVRLRELAEIGAMREEHPTSGPTWNPAKVGAHLIQLMDRRTRLAADRMFSNLVDQGLVKNTETNRREYVNQVGQYNKRAQGPMVRWFRDTGFGPFVTAGRAFNVLGVRTALLKPGAEAESMPARLALAATMASKIAGTMFLIGTLNYVFTKNKGGGVTGRPGTRLGTVDLGVNNKAGKPLTLDLANLLGLGRAARVTGVRGALESVRNNLPIGVAMDSAARDMINSGISPFAGPAVRFASIATTGQQPAVKVPPLAPIVPPGQSQIAQNLRTAAVETSPIIAGIHDSRQPGATGMEWFQKQLGRFTLQPGKSPDMIQNYAQIVDRAQASQYMDDVIRRARSMAPAERLPFIKEAIGHLQASDQPHAWKTVTFKRVLNQ